MIRYVLICGNQHEFESWFSNSAEYDRLHEKGLLECPQCGSHEVRKAMMAPQIGSSRKSSGGGGGEGPSCGGDGGGCCGCDFNPGGGGMGFSSSRPDEGHAALAAPESGRLAQLQAEALAAARELRRQVREKAEYVGPAFAEEARKIHYNETEARPIHGEATLPEARDLAEEGIEFGLLPVLPEDHN